ncbi:mediator of DNA damage checkpoint protein 1-like isoform X2 [Varroa jacobsoni]|uniref:mediator of DNA damage checkpoint protein 1-like isoform X2 n=1 Tax=Varroa jacobsoni TaxID=62625 RepID=UPI000BF8C22F|nr:mediator of DNA damage checkpoint protein 1-like isoform X2 [Varroa jacobsoni]
MKKFEVTITSDRPSTLLLELPSLDAQVVVRFQNGNCEEKDRNVLTAELRVGEHQIISATTEEEKESSASLSTKGRNNQFTDSFAVDVHRPTETSTYASENNNCVSHAVTLESPKKVEASQCEDDIQLNAAIPGLYGSSSPEIIIATEPQNQNSFWVAVPATQQDGSILKPAATGSASDEEIIDTTDDEAFAAEEADNLTSASGMKEKSYAVLEPISMAETPHEEDTSVVVEMTADIGEQSKTRNLSQRRLSQRPLPSSLQAVRVEPSDSEESGSDDSFVGRGSTSSHRKAKVGAAKKFVKKRLVYFSSEDSNVSDEEEKKPEKKTLGKRELPDLNSQLAVESNEQRNSSAVPKTISMLEVKPQENLQEEELSRQEHSTVPETGVLATTKSVQLKIPIASADDSHEVLSPEIDGIVEATEREPTVAPEKVAGNSNDSSALQHDSVLVNKDGEVTEITQSDLSPHRKLCRTQLADDSQVGTWIRETSGGDEKEVEVPSTEEQRVADLDGNSHQNFDGKNEKSLQEKENDATSKRSSPSQKKEDSALKAAVFNRGSRLSVDTQESLKLTILSESLNKDNDEQIEDGPKCGPNTSSSIGAKVPNENVQSNLFELQAPGVNTCDKDVDEAPSSASEEVDISAATMLERLEKLKNRKSAWEQAKEDLRTEGLLNDNNDTPIPTSWSRCSSPEVETVSQIEQVTPITEPETPVGSRKRTSSESNGAPVAKKKRGRPQKGANISDPLSESNSPTVGEAVGSKDIRTKVAERATRKSTRNVSTGAFSKKMPAENAMKQKATGVEKNGAFPLQTSSAAVTDMRVPGPVLVSSPQKTPIVSTVIASATVVLVSDTAPLEQVTVGLITGSSVEETPVDTKFTPSEYSTNVSTVAGTLSSNLTTTKDANMVVETSTPAAETSAQPASSAAANDKHRHSNRQKSLYHSQELNSQSPFESILDPSQNRYALGETAREVANVSRTPKRIPKDVRRVFPPTAKTPRSSKSVMTEQHQDTAKTGSTSTSASEPDNINTNASPTTPKYITARPSMELIYSSDDDVITVASARRSPMITRHSTSTRKSRREGKALTAAVVTKPIDSTPEKEVFVPETIEDGPQDPVEGSENEQENAVLKEAIVVLESSAVGVIEETPQGAPSTQNTTRSRRAARVRSEARLKRVTKSLSSSKQDPTLSQSDPYARDTIDMRTPTSGCEGSPPVPKAQGTRARTRTSKQDLASGHTSTTANLTMGLFSEEISPLQETEENTDAANTGQNTFKQPNPPPQKTKATERNRLSEGQPVIPIRGRSSEAKGKRARLSEDSSSLLSKRSRSTPELPDPELEMSIAGSTTSSGSTLSVNRTAKLRVMFTGIDNAPKDKLSELSVKTTDIPSQCGLVVAAKFTRTVKMMYAVAKGVPVVNLNWVTESYKAKKLLDISQFMLVDKAAEMRYSFNLVATLRVAAEEKIFDGWTFFVTKSCVPNPEQIKEMVSGCNAKVVNKKPTKAAERTAIVTCSSDIASLGKKNAVPVVGVEFVLNGILQHRIDFKKYSVTK